MQVETLPDTAKRRRLRVRMAQRRRRKRLSAAPAAVIAARVLKWILDKGPAGTGVLLNGLCLASGSLRPVLASLQDAGLLTAERYRAASGGFVGTRYSLAEIAPNQ